MPVITPSICDLFIATNSVAIADIEWIVQIAYDDLRETVQVRC